jgi:DNA-binding MarR family transcriptional regulator
MAELPFHLRTLEPLTGALDIIRYIGQLDELAADADNICDALDLSDRSFSKAIRRLVTKGYVTMDGDQSYRLTEQGQTAVEELTEYDDATGGGLGVAPQSSAPEPETVGRRIVLAVPQPLLVGQENAVQLGVYPSDEGNGETSEVVARVSVLNGQPESPEDVMFSLTSDDASQSLNVTPDAYTHVRIRVEVFQLGDNPGDIYNAGGMYVDIPVASGHTPSQLIGYGTDIQLTV